MHFQTRSPGQLSVFSVQFGCFSSGFRDLEEPSGVLRSLFKQHCLFMCAQLLDCVQSGAYFLALTKQKSGFDEMNPKLSMCLY